MLQLNSISDAYCQGVVFNVTDADGLAKAVALILVQEYRLARRLLAGAPCSATTIALTHDEIDDIIARRLHPADIYHRDGFIFQLVMWLASHLDLQAGDLVALPHSQGSAKGQDSIIVHRTRHEVVALTICEDKATENPRDTVRDEVWPEIKDYENGERSDELRSNVIATLGTGGVPADEATELIRDISWAGKRRYRVRVTVEQHGRSPHLFKGFENIVRGDNVTRRGETLALQSMRNWMETFSHNVESELRRIAT